MDRVPNTATFSMCDVKNVVTSVPLNLSSAIATACDTWWDKNYCGSKNSLLNFRNYGVPSILLYGISYNWYAASNTCLGRNGWCVPTNDEWVSLGMSLPSTSYQAPAGSSEKVFGASKQMKSVGNFVDGTGLWCKAASSANEGTNSSGMNIKPGGIVSNTGVYSGERDYADFWTRSQNPSGATLGMYWNFGYNGSDMYRGTAYYCKNYGFSIRLIRFSGSSTSYTDYEGNTYTAAAMPDGRVWMTENLRTQYYCDGTLIPRYTGTTWQNTTIGAIYGIAPVITLSGASTVSIPQNGTYVESGATAMDSIDGNITADIVITGTVNTSVVGTYYKYYNVMNSMSIPAAQITRTINVIVPATTVSLLNIDGACQGTNGVTACVSNSMTLNPFGSGCYDATIGYSIVKPTTGLNYTQTVSVTCNSAGVFGCTVTNKVFSEAGSFGSFNVKAGDCVILTACAEGDCVQSSGTYVSVTVTSITPVSGSFTLGTPATVSVYTYDETPA